MVPDFVYTQVYKNALKRGASQLFAQQRASICQRNYSLNKFNGKLSAYIESEIKEAVRLTKKINKK